MLIFTFLLTLKNFIFLWTVEDKLLIKRKDTILLSSILFAIFLMLPFMPALITSLLNVLYVVFNMIILVKIYGNWLIAALSFAVRSFILLAVWLLSYALPNNLFQLKYAFFPSRFLLQSILLFIFCFSIRLLLKKYNFLIVLKSIQKKYRLFSLLIYFYSISIFVISQSISRQISAQKLLIIYLLLYFSGFFICFFFFYLLSSNYNQRQSYLSLSKSMDSITEKYEETTEFRHDYKNILISIKEYLNKNEMSNAQNYIDSIIAYSSPVLLPDYYVQILNLSIPPLQAVLVSFGERADSKKINVHLDIPEKIYQIDMDLIDLVRCLTILLDNALEAYFESNDYYIKVSIIQTAEHTAILIKNPLSPTNNLSLNEMFKDKFSSKQDHLGKGLTIINKLTSEYTDVTANFHIENMTFYANLTILNILMKQP